MDATAAGLRLADARIAPVCVRRPDWRPGGDARPDLTILSRREQEIYTLIYSGGDSDLQLASKLSISVKTVGHHVCSILEKLGYGSRHQIRPRSRKRPQVLR